MSIRPRRSLLNPNLQRPNSFNSKPRSELALWLDKNENLDPVLHAVLTKAFASIPKKSISTYPEAAELYKKLSDWVGVEPSSLLLTPGSDGAIRLTFEAFIEDGDIVLHTTPTFAMYKVYCQMFGALEIEIEYFSLNGKPLLDVEEILRSINKYKPKIVCLPNPDSPTGSVLTPDILQHILSTCENSNTLLLIDEAYHPFYEWSAVPWTKKSKNLVIARTFAKAWGSAGLRIGYLVGHPETITLLNKMRPMYEVSTIAVEYMSIMLNKVSEMESSVLRIKLGKSFFQKAMRNLGYKVLETEGNFVHVAFSNDLEKINTALAGHVLYRGSFEHVCLSGYTRFTAAPIEVMLKVVDLIKNSITNGSEN